MEMPMPMPDHKNHSSGGMDMGMKMYFHLGYNEKHLIFKNWNIHNVAELIGSMIAFIILAFLYEGLKALRESLRQKEVKEKIRMSRDFHNNLYGERQPLVSENNVKVMNKPPMISKMRLVQAFLHVLQMFMGYVLMLAFMAYNTWICIGILLGGGIGFLVFTWVVDQPKSDSADHCM